MGLENINTNLKGVTKTKGKDQKDLKNYKQNERNDLVKNTDAISDLFFLFRLRFHFLR